MDALINRIIKFPRLILVITLIISAGFFIVMKKNSRMETDLDKYMPQHHPAFVYSNQAEDWFNIKDKIIIAIENKNGIYNKKTIGKVKELTKILQGMKEINKDDVTSLYTADNIVGTEDGMDVKTFFESVPETKEAFIELSQKVKSNEMVFKRLVSEDETVAVIIAEIGDDVFSQKFYNQILKTAKRFEGPEKTYVAGRPIVEGTMAVQRPRDMKRMVPLVIAVIIIVLILLLKSLKSTLFTLLVVLLSTIWTFGLMAATGIPVYSISTMIPVMLIAIGVADGIHLFSSLQLYLRKKPDADKKEAVTEMMRGMWKPVVMTSVTTAIGFISLLTSQVYPIKYFGVFTAFGVLSAMFLSLVLIPAAIMTFGLPRWKKQDQKKVQRNGIFSSHFTDYIIKYKSVTVFLTVVIIFLSLMGMRKVWINSSFLEKFEKNSDIVLTDKFINEHFGGTSTLNVILDSDNPMAFKNPDVLKAMNKMQADVEGSLKVVGNSFAITDYLRRMNKVMHADKEEYNSIPDSQELIAQYLLLYEMSGNPDNLWKVVDYGYKKANLKLQLKSDNSRAIKSAIGIIEKHLPQFDKLKVRVKYAGSGYKALVFTDLILEGQILSIIMSFAIVVLLLSIMFKNFTIGLIGSIPIAVTAMISFGMMGLFNIPLGTTTAILSSIGIGIGIDYAVHFLQRYQLIASTCNDKLLCSRQTMEHSGRAIAFNAVVVIAGFLVLLFSVFPPNRALGALVSLNMFTSFVGTVTIMFVVLYASNVYYKKEEKVSQWDN